MIKELAIQEAISSGQDPATVVIEEPVWEWTAADCDPAVSDCGFGLDEPPEETSEE